MIYLTGDTHRSIDIEKLNNKNFPEGKSLTRDDYVIVLGDFGFIWDTSKENEYWLNWLCEKPYTVLFIDGNHENFDLLEQYPEELWKGGKIHRIANNIIHLMRGQVFNIDDKKFFTFGGATSIDKLSSIEFISWWKQELPTYKELEEGIGNMQKNNYEVDYILTHCCSSKTLETVSAYAGFRYNYDEDILNKYFNVIQQRTTFKHWYFGHYHLDINEVVDNQTVVFNRIKKIK